MNPEEVIRIILILSIIIFVLVMTLQLGRVLNNTNEILKNAKNVSHGLSIFLSSPQKIKDNISDLAILSVEKIIDSHVQRLRASFRGNIVNNLLNFIFQK